MEEAAACRIDVSNMVTACSRSWVKDFKHNEIVVGRKCRYGLGFECWALFRECYVKDAGGRVVWEVSRLVWAVEGDVFVNAV